MHASQRFNALEPRSVRKPAVDLRHQLLARLADGRRIETRRVNVHEADPAVAVPSGEQLHMAATGAATAVVIGLDGPGSRTRLPTHGSHLSAVRPSGCPAPASVHGTTAYSRPKSVATINCSAAGTDANHQVEVANVRAEWSGLAGCSDTQGRSVSQSGRQLQLHLPDRAHRACTPTCAAHSAGPVAGRAALWDGNPQPHGSAVLGLLGHDPQFGLHVQRPPQLIAVHT